MRRDERTAQVRARIARLIRDRRGSVDGADHVDLFDERPGADPTALLRGELLVRSSLARADPDLLASLVARVGPAQERLRGRLLVLTGDLPPERLVRLARQVRGRGHEASVNHVVPLNIVCKGDGGPARTSVPGQVVRPAPGEHAVRVAVIDSGVAVEGRDHEWQSGLRTVENVDLLDAFSASTQLALPDGYLDAAAGHGAFTTGIVQQVAPECFVVMHKAIDSDGVGSEVQVAEALLDAVEDGAEIVNLSLGAQTLDDQPPLALQVALELLEEGGHDDVLLVAAAGNYGSTRPCWPAAFGRVVAVAGLAASVEAGAQAQPATWSSRGDWVDVSTVAEGLISTYVRGRESEDFSPSTAPDDWPLDDPRPWALWSGTSFAAPQVAAEVARRLGEQRAAGRSDLTPRTVLAGLLGEGRAVPSYGVAVDVLAGTVR